MSKAGCSRTKVATACHVFKFEFLNLHNLHNMLQDGMYLFPTISRIVVDRNAHQQPLNWLSLPCSARPTRRPDLNNTRSLLFHSMSASDLAAARAWAEERDTFLRNYGLAPAAAAAAPAAGQ